MVQEWSEADFKDLYVSTAWPDFSVSPPTSFSARGVLGWPTLIRRRYVLPAGVAGWQELSAIGGDYVIRVATGGSSENPRYATTFVSAVSYWRKP